MALIANELPENVWQKIQINAGVLCKSFDTKTWTVKQADILGATSGGLNFTDTPEYSDFGEDIDNCPKNTYQLKRFSSREVKVSGTYVALGKDTLKNTIGGADITETSKGSGQVAFSTIKPRDELKEADFQDLWIVGDYGDSGNGIAVHLMKTLSTGGLNWQTTDKEKGQFSFEYSAHYSLTDYHTVPYEVCIKDVAASE
mgnify:CR=1 FL=1